MSSKKPLLFIHGGDEVAHWVLQNHGNIYYSAAFQVVLERHGYIDFDIAPPDVLESLDRLSQYAAVLVAWLPKSYWKPEYWQTIRKTSAKVILEGPLPDNVLKDLEISNKGRGAVDTEFIPNSDLGAIGIKKRTFLLRQIPKWQVPLVQPKREDPWPSDGIDPWTNTPTYIPDLWEAPSPFVHARVKSGTECGIGGVDTGRIIAFSGSLLALCVQSLSCPAFECAYYTTSQTFDSSPLEHWIVNLLGDSIVDAGHWWWRVCSWPNGATSALSIRLDVDRKMSRASFEQVLARHADLGLKATWYWNPTCLNPEAMRLVESSGAEIAYHSVSFCKGADLELQSLKNQLRLQEAIWGNSAHGGAGSDGWLGSRNILWAERNGLRHSEILGGFGDWPYRFPHADSNGRVRISELVIPTTHLSFDVSTRPGDVNDDGVSNSIRRAAKVGGMKLIMNHPDIHQDEFGEVMSEFSSMDIWKARVVDVADWWSRTHRHQVLSLEPDPVSRKLKLVAKRNVVHESVDVEILGHASEEWFDRESLVSGKHANARRRYRFEVSETMSRP